jgi:hypothetical protein
VPFVTAPRWSSLSVARSRPARSTGAQSRCCANADSGPSPSPSPSRLPDRLAEHDRPALGLGEYNELIDSELVGS